MDKKDKLNRFKKLDFEGFRELAKDPNLSPYEKIGFPDSYRAGHEARIFADIRAKLTVLDQPQQTILDIGPGCSDLPRYLIEHCQKMSHRLILIDSAEMLNMLPDADFIVKIPAMYPRECPQLFDEYREQINGIIVYSVLQYVFAEGNIHEFVDRSLSLLANGGGLLLGDLPNIAKRKRFFSSQTGIRYHQEFMQTDEAPLVDHLVLEPEHIDDGVIFGMMMRSRMAGFDSYLLPQSPDLPMANRREDMLIQRP